MNNYGYGYDFYVPNNDQYINNMNYIETMKPLDTIENFENDVNNLLQDNDEKSILQKIYTKKENLCNTLQNKFNMCMQQLKHKHMELNYYHNHVFFLYIILLFSILFIFYQRININNLHQLIYILKLNIGKSLKLEKNNL